MCAITADLAEVWGSDLYFILFSIISFPSHLLSALPPQGRLVEMPFLVSWGMSICLKITFYS